MIGREKTTCPFCSSIVAGSRSPFRQDFYGCTRYICVMSGRMHFITAGLFAVLIISLSFCSGCTSTTVGDTWYENQSVRAMVSHTGEPANLTVQLTVYRIDGMSQEFFTVINTPVSLSQGDTLVILPTELPPGSYKLFVYVLGDNDRKTAVIRDITV